MSEESESPTRGEMRYLASVLEGLNFPARRWQIITWATYNGAGLQMVGALQNIPEINYQSVGHVGRELFELDADCW